MLSGDDAVDGCDVGSGAHDVQTRAGGRCVEMQSVAELGGSAGGDLLRVSVGEPEPADSGEFAFGSGVGAANPLRVPIGGREKAGLKEGWGGGCGLVLVVPDSDLPEVAGLRFEGGACVGDVDGVGGGDAAGVPHVGFAGSKIRFARGDKELIRRLHPVGGGRVALPGELRLRSVDAERVGHVFGAELNRRGGGGEGEKKGRCEDRGSDESFLKRGHQWLRCGFARQCE